MTTTEINSAPFLELFKAWNDSDFMLVVLDSDGKIKFLNKKSCEFFGITEQEIVGKDLLRVLNIHEGEKLCEIISKIKIKEPLKYEINVLAKDGSKKTAIFEFRNFSRDGVEGLIGIGALPNSPTLDWLEFLDLLLEERTQALKESEMKYRELVELAKSIIFKWDADGKVIWMNEYGLKFFGFSEEEVVGRSVYETFVPRMESTGRDLSTLVKDIVENEDKYASNINENIKKDGTRVWIHWSNRPIKDSKGELVAILSIGTEITDRIKMEKMKDYELKKSRAISRLYSLLVSPTTKIDDVEVAILEEAKAITESECGFIGRIDLRTGELIATKFVQEHACKVKEKRIKIQDVDGKPRSLIGHAVKTLKPFYTNLPKEHFAYNGVPEWHIKIERFLAAPILIEGRSVGILALANSKRDYNDQDLEAIAEMSRYFVLALQRMKYEEELILRENLYRTLFENAPVPTLLLDENGIMSNINTAFERLSGYKKEEVEGKKSWKEFVYPEDIQKLEVYRTERLAGRHAPSSYEFRFLDRHMNV
ncbi:MAG: PAS domain S-box protein, partial [Candidatus Methanomethyliaceae archaeon]|nr:PAS domain S-box protein [Candidatus Methanomethyliaceae archaeon]